MAKGAFQLLFGGFCPLHIWTCLKFAKKIFYAYLPWIWKLTRFTRFIWKVFVTKILLSGKFSLFQTLLQSNENVPLWSLHLLEMYQNRMMCQIDQGSISVPSRCTLHTPSTHGFLFWPNTQQSTSMWRDDLVQAGDREPPILCFPSRAHTPPRFFLGRVRATSVPLLIFAFVPTGSCLFWGVMGNPAKCFGLSVWDSPISYHVFQFGNLLNIGLMVTMATIR